MTAITKATIRKHGSVVFTKYTTIFGFAAFVLFLAAVGNVLQNGTNNISRSVIVEEKHDTSSKDPDTSTIHKNNVRTSSTTSTSSSATTSSSNSNNSSSTAVSPFVRGDAMLFHHTLGANIGKEAAIILDMLEVHAHSYMDSNTYGGSCGEGNDVGRDPENSLIEAIGLSKEIRFACPRDSNYEGRKKMIAYRHYSEDGTRTFTPEYVDLLKSVVEYPERSDVFPEDPDRFTIVIHIKRGEKVSPCRKPFKDYDPYLPNLHYQTLIDKYTKQNARIIIFSHTPSYESFDVFKDKGYELHLDEPIANVWRYMLVADVAIMSRSSFSFVPAVVSKATVVYTPFWHKPIRGWETVGKDVLASSAEELKRLQATCPPKVDKFAHLRANGRV